MALKGKTTFELTNVETGEVSVIKDNNMVTNGIKYLLRNIGAQSTTGLYKLNYDGTEPVSGGTGIDRQARMLTGGLMLFDSAIEEDVDAVIPPAGTVLVACGTSKAYSGVNASAGSYNIVESGAVTDENGKVIGYKHIWDFSTSQGNGHIACACLTTRDGGIDTWGSSYYDASYATNTTNGNTNREYYDELNSIPNAVFYNTNADGTPPNPSGNSYQPFAESALYFDYDRDIAICLNNSKEVHYYFDFRAASTPTTETFLDTIYAKREVKLDVKRLGLKSFSLFDPPGSRFVSHKILDTVTVPMPVALQNELDTLIQSDGYWNTQIFTDEGFIYITWRKELTRTGWSYIPPGEKIHVWKINVSDFTSEGFTVTNTTGKSVLCSYSSYFPNYMITNKCCIVQDKDTRQVYSISLEDNTDVNPILLPTGENFATTKDTGLNRAFVIQDRLFIDEMYVIDLTTNTANYLGRTIFSQLRNSATPNWVYSTEAEFRCRPVFGNSMGLVGYLRMCRYTSSSYYQQYAYWSFCQLTSLLLTINNLDTPVTKTTAQTMKVTYTLLEEGDEEE